MKVAHLILAHKDPAQVARLINRIAHPGNSVFLHIDAKHDLESFAGVGQMPNVSIMTNRIEVNWGGYSIVQATINGLRAIVASGKAFDYVNLISGQDYPIKPIADFTAMLEQNPGKAFFNYCLPGEPWMIEAQRKIETYHFTDLHLKGKYAIQKLVNTIMPRRKVPQGYTVIGRSAWFTIDEECTRYILKCCDENQPIINFFKKCWGSDEMFFHTLIYNSPLKDKMINHNYRYIDWSEGNPRPKTFGMEDLPHLEETDAFFARKFDMDSEVIDYIDKNMLAGG